MTAVRTNEDILQEILQETKETNRRLTVLETKEEERQERCKLHERQLTQHDKRISGLEQDKARIEGLPKRVEDLADDVQDARDALSSLKGSWKTWLAIISAISGFLGGVIGGLIRRWGG
jgi:seryl-tRNA synthetase